MQPSSRLANTVAKMGRGRAICHLMLPYLMVGTLALPFSSDSLFVGAAVWFVVVDIAFKPCAIHLNGDASLTAGG